MAAAVTMRRKGSIDTRNPTVPQKRARKNTCRAAAAAAARWDGGFASVRAARRLDARAG